MKTKIIKHCVVVLLISVALEFLYFNFSATLSLLRGDTAGPVYEMSDMEILNWDKDDEVYVTGIDPMLVMEDVDAYVQDIDIHINAPQQFQDSQIFFTESDDEEFTGEKSVMLQENASNIMHAELNRSICDLRLDLSEVQGLRLNDIRVEINPVGTMNFSWAHIVVIQIAYLLLFGLNQLQKGPDYSKILKKNLKKSDHGKIGESENE